MSNIAKNSLVKILLVEDNPADIDLIIELLNEAIYFDFNLKNTENLTDGLEILEEEHFDIILLDLSLPDSHGFETIINTRERVEDIPIIVLTGLNDELIARKAVQAGAQDYLIKGQIESNPLVRSIYHAIDRHGMLKTIESLVNTLQKDRKNLKKIIDFNADSILIVSKEGKVRFANPGAVKLFGIEEKNLIGRDFGIPSINGDTTNINIVNGKGKINVAEMNAVDINWEGEEAYLLSLRDISDRIKYEKKIRESERKYRELFENSPYPIALLSGKFELVDCNSGLEELLGYKKSELLGLKYRDYQIFSKEDKFRILDYLENEKNSINSQPVELDIRKKHGKQMCIKLNFSSINLKNEKFNYILIEDITDLKQSKKVVKKLEQTLHEMNALIEHAPQPIFLMHISGKILRVNKEAKDLLGYIDKEILSTNICNLFPYQYKDRVINHFCKDIYKSSIPNKIESTVKTKDGRLINVEIISTILRIADNVIIQSFFSDITERKSYEYKRQLLLDQLISSIEFKSKFLATMSHELRTPLNAILGFSQILLEESWGKLNDQQIDYLKDIYSAGTHLLTLINSILDLSKIEAGKFKLNLEKFNLGEFLEEIHMIIKPLYSKKKLQFHIKKSFKSHEIIADPLRLKQILFNLLSNAIKFTEKGNIDLLLFEDDRFWEFQIIDTGIGIAKEDYDVIFREFGRIENDKTKEIQGAGLGLALARRLINLHGGKIWFESEFGKGSKFYFKIPKLSLDNKS
ncbi:MAG: PAS domain S-box protein [Candidatus Lokiarchaeota archaeon]|nr:PAS domain S-box protein [Candidatus Lokiarchaeota archaeon]